MNKLFPRQIPSDCSIPYGRRSPSILDYPLSALLADTILKAINFVSTSLLQNKGDAEINVVSFSFSNERNCC